MNDLPGIAFKIEETDGKVNGTAIFYFQERSSADGAWHVNPEHPAPLLVHQEKLNVLLTGKSLTEDLAQQAGELAARSAKPLTTSALTPEYRREMVRVFTKRALLAAAG